VRCSHSKCAKACNEPCVPCAEEKCQSCCPHSECSMPCAAPCDWIPCSKRCEQLLKCGHQCKEDFERMTPASITYTDFIYRSIALWRSMSGYQILPEMRLRSSQAILRRLCGVETL
jgi:hypothetical protein